MAARSVRSAGALLAVGALREARHALSYLVATQAADGHWNQNQWLGGTGHWTGVQLDETAFPVLLATTLAERGALGGTEVTDMIRRALSFLVRHGPVSEQDRWEEDAGLNTFTLAVCVAALVAGAGLLERKRASWRSPSPIIGTRSSRSGPRCATRRSRSLYGVPRYYVRVAPGESVYDDRCPRDAVLPIRNLAVDPRLPASAQVSVDFLQLVRFGLRRPDDALIVASLKVADALLKVQTPSGACWHRYNEDGYGEHDDGSAYDGTGRGRALAAADRRARSLRAVARGRDPLPLSGVDGRMAPRRHAAGADLGRRTDSGRGLLPGRPTGAAMPLVWAHAEYLKLAASRQRGAPFDRPTAARERDRGERPLLKRAIPTE